MLTEIAAMYNKILVTGASGRLGSNLVKRLVEGGVGVRSFVLPNDPAEKALDGLETEKSYGDLRDETAVSRAAKGTGAIVHCGAVMGAPRGELTAHHIFDINVRGTFNVFHAATQEGSSIKKVVHLSSTAAYDVSTAGPIIREDCELRPLNLYGTTKAASETIIRAIAFQTSMPTVVLRPNYIMACDEIFSFGRAGAVISALRSGANDHRYTLYEPGVKKPWKIVEGLVEGTNQRCVPRNLKGQPWTWHVTDVRDAVQAALLSLTRDEGNGHTFNVAGPEPARWDEVVPYLCERLGESYVEVRIPNLWHFELDLTQSKNLLGYKPQYDPKRMIDDAIAFRDGEDIGVIPSATAH